MGGASDEQRIVQAAITGDRDAMAALMVWYRPAIESLIRAKVTGSAGGSGADVEDLAQDVTLKACRAIATFHYAGDGAVWAWLRSITENAVRNWIRGRRRASAVEPLRIVERLTEPRSRGSPTRRLRLQESIARLTETLPQLKDDDRVVLELRYRDGMTPTAIGTLTGRSPQAVSNHIRRALNRLREKLGTESIYGWTST